MITPNDFKGLPDIDRIEAAIANRENGTVYIPQRKPDEASDRTYWLIDRAILLPSDTTVVLQNCKIKLSDRARDNFFRSANVLGEETWGTVPSAVHNIRIIGEGGAELEGADHPRSTGDGGKLLGCPVDINENEFNNGMSYGTDALKKEEFPCGGWRNIGILIANATDVVISNLRITEPHAWGISLEFCERVRIEKIDFRCSCIREIDGVKSYCMNQDGIDLRCGCRDVIVSDITGVTGDDIVALTAIHNDPNQPVRYEYPEHHQIAGHTQVMKIAPEGKTYDIENVIVRNVIGYSPWCCNVRLLALGTKIRNVVVDGVVDTSPDDNMHWCDILLGEGPGCCYGDVFPDSISYVTISNVIGKSWTPIAIPGYLKNSVISNVVNRTDNPTVVVNLKDSLDNVSFNNVQGEFQYLNNEVPEKK